MSTKILNPQFVDLEKTIVRFQIQNADGVISNAELKVPKNMARGVNPYWDRILDEFNVDQMRKERNDRETRERKQREANDKKRKAGEENERLRRLFNRKMKAFEAFYIKEADATIKSAIRRAPDDEFLTLILNKAVNDYMQANNMSLLDFMDKMEEIEDEKILGEKANTTPQPEDIVASETPAQEESAS